MVDIPAFGRRPEFKQFPFSQEDNQEGMTVCPGIALYHSRETFWQKGLVDSLKHSWGPVLQIWEVYAADREIRYKGASGGAITALALYCLEHEKMEGALHVQVDPDHPHRNTTVLSRDRESLLEGTGSRYSPASPCEKLNEVEQADSKCVVIGKPCDIAATSNIRKIRPILDEKVGLTIACFCAGTPSTNGTLEMLRQMGVGSPKDLESLRYRGHGWPGTTKAELKGDVEDTTLRELEYNESWGEILQKYRQWRCYICPDHTGEFADIAVGDPWYKLPKEGDQGRSLLVARSEKGKRIIAAAFTKGYLIGGKQEAGILPASQPNLLKTRGRIWGQLIALKLLCAPYPTYLGFSLKSTWVQNLTLREKVSSIFGTMKRIFDKKINTSTNISS